MRAHHSCPERPESKGPPDAAPGDGDELYLDALLGPFVAHHLEAHADHPMRIEQGSLLFQATHRQPGGLIVGVGESCYLAIAMGGSVGNAGVV